MTDFDIRNNNTISTELTNDLHFLIIEVKHLLTLVKDTINTVNQSKLEKAKKRIDYIENLESRIKTLSYDAIFKLKTKHKPLILNYRALINITSNLSRISDFMILAANQINHIQDNENFKDYNLSPFYECIDKQLDLIHQAFTEIDVKTAKEICKSEVQLDQLYLDQFNYIQENISNKEKSPDMITLLFIVKYFERIGDSLLNIGESILNISIGDSLNIKYYQKLEEVVKKLSNKNKTVVYDFKPFLFSRSGCKVGRLMLAYETENGTLQEKFFYKQGDTDKIKEEIEGLELWNKKAPQTAPTLLWKSIEKENSTLVVNYVQGKNLLNIILGDSKNSDVIRIADALQKKLDQIWSSNKIDKSIKSKTVKQIINRKDAISNVHENFFEEFTFGKKNKVLNFDKMLLDAKKLEKEISIPFKVLCHGDFNLDNVLFQETGENIYFVDVHRSGYSDYAQEIAVFIVSCLRIKIEDLYVRKKIKTLCNQIFEFAKDFAIRNEDESFQARLAFGLFRSFVTSTRFVSDDVWYDKMRMNAILVYKELKASEDDLNSLTINLDKILK